jgi:nitrite reductase/ring-hydroxylating ferredoxin subunit/DMSO/TMAO reductase YedYZ heme-binding membrane subunit
VSATYTPVGWNRTKLIYDALLAIAVMAYVLIFIRVAHGAAPDGSPLDEPTIRMRAFGSCAFLMLSFILCIGPLARLDSRLLPLLYNRRHFGVLTSVVALTHASHVLGWYFGFSPVDPYVALLSANAGFTRLAGFPFEIFGVFALMILAVLAATSHDFWLAFLTPPVWKALHMSIYAAWTAAVAHVALGAMSAPYNGALTIVVIVVALLVASLNLAAARVVARENAPTPILADGWIAVGPPSRIVEGRGIVVPLANAESVAIFRHAGRLSAISNACAHQNGPLGEGRIVDGCVTCPWHGFQYRPEDGVAPPPYTEKLATYRLRLRDGLIELDPRSNPPGTFVEPLPIAGDAA